MYVIVVHHDPSVPHSVQIPGEAWPCFLRCALHLTLCYSSHIPDLEHRLGRRHPLGDRNMVLAAFCSLVWDLQLAEEVLESLLLDVVGLVKDNLHVRACLDLLQSSSRQGGIALGLIYI